MLPFNRKKKDKYAGNPAWLKWIVLVFVGYAIFNHYVDRQSKPEHSKGTVFNVNNPPSDGTALTRADFGTYILPRGISIGGDIPGRGEEARCGQTATLRYEEILPDDARKKAENAAAPAAPEEITVQVGVNLDDKPWVTALPGMQAGGIREIKVLAGMMYSEETLKEMGLKETDYIGQRVEMLEVTPKADTSHIPFQATERIDGTGEIINCGSIADFHLIIWNQDGTKAYDSRDGEGNPLTMKVGESEIMYGLDRGMLNMKPGGIRSIIIPPGYAVLTSDKKNPLQGIVKEGNIVLAEIELLDVRWKK